jgi:replicative DNA helicase
MLSVRRELADLTRLGDEWDGDSTGFLDEAQRRFLSLAAGNDAAESRPRRIADLMGDFWQRFEEEYENPQAQRGLPTGFPALDDRIRGLCGGELIVIAAETGQGKSALAANIAVNTCRLTGKAAVLFSLEMQWRELLERMVFAESGVDSTGYRRKALSEREWQQLADARDRLASMNISIHDDSGLTASRIVTSCREAKFAKSCDLVVVDYTQLVSPPEAIGRNPARQENREREVAMVVHALQRMAMDLNVPVIALSQLNDDGRVRESRAISHFANVMLRLKCLEDPDGEGYSEKTEYSYDLIVEKCRAGQKGKIPLVFCPSLTRFKEQAA